MFRLTAAMVRFAGEGAAAVGARDAADWRTWKRWKRAIGSEMSGEADAMRGGLKLLRRAQSCRRSPGSGTHACVRFSTLRTIDYSLVLQIMR